MKSLKKPIPEKNYDYKVNIQHINQIHHNKKEPVGSFLQMNLPVVVIIVVIIILPLFLRVVGVYVFRKFRHVLTQLVIVEAGSSLLLIFLVVVPVLVLVLVLILVFTHNSEHLHDNK